MKRYSLKEAYVTDDLERFMTGAGVPEQPQQPELQGQNLSIQMGVATVVPQSIPQSGILLRCMMDLLSLLRAIHWDMHTSHWLVNGEAFFSQHNMFSEMYKSIETDYDILAEKIVGVFEEYIISKDLMKASYLWLNKVQSIECLHERALKLETLLVGMIKECLASCEHEMTPGISNMLEQIADNHEKNIYFLKQSIKEV